MICQTRADFTCKQGQIKNFNEYHEHVLEWIKLANDYKLPTFVMGIGLGGLIILNLLEKVDRLPIEGMILFSPLLELQKNKTTRKDILISNIGKVSKDTRFKVNIEVEQLTRNEEIREETVNDGLMLKSNISLVQYCCGRNERNIRLRWGRKINTYITNAWF